jgi:radical SAM superfamily enzyme YgiQ (UPF0313 family)
MPLIEPVIRPPSEADSLLLQLTVGCSANSCAFCGAYLRKPFSLKSDAEIFGDIEALSRRSAGTRRIFLLDGDALAVPQKRLVPILDALVERFPALSRIASYANGYNITRRSREELLELSERKLRLIYLGLESGSQEILDRCRKLSSVRQMIEAVRGAEDAGIKSSVIVLLGLGGKKSSELHIRETVKALNEMQPRYLSFLSLMMIPGTPLARDARAGTFEELGAKELLTEARQILEGLEMKRTIFRSDHASNYLALEGRLPHDKSALLTMIDAALSGRVALRPDFFRGL